MYIATLLAVSTSYDPYDVPSLQEEKRHLRRLLAATARSYNVIKKELDVVREELSLNKSPIRFRELPKEKGGDKTLIAEPL